MEKVTLYAKFNYSKVDEELVNILEEYLNNNVEKIYNFFDNILPRKIIDINIIETKEKYDEIVRSKSNIKDVPKWDIGNYHNNTITYVSFNDYKNTSHEKETIEYYKKTIIHEYVHYVVSLYANNKPLRYLNEGIAQYLSNKKEGEIEFNYTVDDILNSNNCYQGYYQLTKYIIEEYGKDYFLELLKDNELALQETERLVEEYKKIEE